MDRFTCEPAVRVVIFTSPKAGSGKSREVIPQITERLQNLSVEVCTIHDVQQLRQIAERPDGRQTIVIAAGGDGTISLAAASVWTLDVDPTPMILPLPLGTENLLARHFGHRASTEQVLDTIRGGLEYRLDAGTANGLPFLIMASCGFDAEVVRGMHLTRRGHIRRLSYFNPIVRALRGYRFPTIQICVDGGEPLECCWAMAFNLPRYGGGLRIEPDAVGDDGLFDVIAFTRGSILSGLQYASSVWMGSHLKRRDVVRCRGRQIEITSIAKVPYQIDGDYAGRLPLKIEVQPRRVRLLIPTASPFSQSPLADQQSESHRR